MSNSSRRRAAAARQPSPPAPPAAASVPPARVAQAAILAQPSVAAADQAQETAPAGSVFNLDAVANEAKRGRFQFEAGGRIWYLRSPEELNWLNHSIAVQFAVMEDLRPFMRQVLAEQYEEFVDLPIELTKIYALIAEYQRWHGVKIPESSASPRS